MVLFMINYFRADKFVLHEVLRMVYLSSVRRSFPGFLICLPPLFKLCSFLAHKKFATEFVDRGGMKYLLSVPREPYVTGSVALCFLGLASISSVMEKVCLLPDPTTRKLVEYCIWLMSSSHETARKVTSTRLALIY